MAGPRKSSKAFNTTNITPRKGHGHSLLGGLLPIWSTTAFWIPVKPLHLRSMLSKSIRCTENYNACSQHWLTEWAHFFSTATPNYTLHNQCFKNWMNCATEFYLVHLPYSPDLLPTYYHFFKDLDSFLQRKCSHNQQEAENAFSESSSNPKVCIFYPTEINLFLVGKNVLIVMIPILNNKDVFKPSYNDLKFMLWNPQLLLYQPNSLVWKTNKTQMNLPWMHAEAGKIRLWHCITETGLQETSGKFALESLGGNLPQL